MHDIRIGRKNDRGSGLKMSRWLRADDSNGWKMDKKKNK